MSNTINELSDLATYIDDEIKNKLSSNDYVNIMNKLGKVYKTLDGETSDTDLTDNNSTEPVYFYEINWNSLISNYINKYSINRTHYLNSKFNLINHINKNDIVNCNCNHNLPNHNCLGNVINCKYIQKLLINYPLLIIPLYCDKYPLSLLINEFNKFYKLKSKPILNRELHLMYNYNHYSNNFSITNDELIFSITYNIFEKLKTRFSADTEISYLCNFILNFLIMNLVCNKYYLVKRKPNIHSIFKHCKTNLDQYYNFRSDNDIINYFMKLIF